MGARVDPTLREQLDQAAASDHPVVAVFHLHGETSANRGAEQIKAMADEVIARVERETGTRVHDVNVFGNLGSFVVAAGAPLIRKLIEQPEIAAVVANRQKRR